MCGRSGHTDCFKHGFKLAQACVPEATAASNPNLNALCGDGDGQPEKLEVVVAVFVGSMLGLAS